MRDKYNLMVGFKEDFPHLLKPKKEIKQYQYSVSFIYTCNAGSIDKNTGHNKHHLGGRVIEACHFVDLLLYLSNSNIKSFN